MATTEFRRRQRRCRNRYVHTEAGWRKNLREINRLRANLACGKGNGATTAALERRELASRQWVNGETAR